MRNNKHIRNASFAFNYARLVEKYLVKPWLLLNEKLRGVDLSLFDDAIAFFADEKGKHVTPQEAYSIALDKNLHKDLWYTEKRDSLDKVLSFYQESHWYPLRQPYFHRADIHRWFGLLLRYFQNPSVLEYGCGSAILTGRLFSHYPGWDFTVADIPSTTLDFVRYKAARHNHPFEIVQLSGDNAQADLSDKKYSLITCLDVLEHVPSPLDVVRFFAEHLQPNGMLLLTFPDDPGGENLESAAEQRPEIISFLGANLYPIKALTPKDKPALYLKTD